jgi:hypothetical protein
MDHTSGGLFDGNCRDWSPDHNVAEANGTSSACFSNRHGDRR